MFFNTHNIKKGMYKNIYQRITFLLLLLYFTSSISPQPHFSTLINSGPSSKVVDLVLFSEAYTNQEDFINDATRLSTIFTTGAYSNFAPIISVHLIFIPSATNHVGKSSHSIDTAFKLYREIDQPLRSILPTEGFTYSYAKTMCQKLTAPDVNKCDYLVIMAHDQYYGGLGDEIAIVSSSPTTGEIGLRHELGHNFADIGEEYDGGMDYSGGNFATSNRVCRFKEGPRTVDFGDGVVRDIWPCISWSKWLTQPLAIGVDVVRKEPMHLLVAKWPWYSFSSLVTGTETLKNSMKIEFYNDCMDCTGRIVFSTAGMSRKTSLLILTLDQIPLEINYTKDATTIHSLPNHKDRHFQTIDFRQDGKIITLTKGKHVLMFQYISQKQKQDLQQEKNEENKEEDETVLNELAPQLCHYMIYSRGRSMNTSPQYIGAYPVYSTPGKLEGYRPTDNTCLMRSMESTHLCPICQELIWTTFASKHVRFVQSIDYTVTTKATTKGTAKTKNNKFVRVTLNLPLLGRHRIHSTNGDTMTHANNDNNDNNDNNENRDNKDNKATKNDQNDEKVEKERFELKWYRGDSSLNSEEGSLRNVQEWTRLIEDGVGCWRVVVRYITPSVRGMPNPHLITPGIMESKFVKNKKTILHLFFFFFFLDFC